MSDYNNWIITLMKLTQPNLTLLRLPFLLNGIDIRQQDLIKLLNLFTFVALREPVAIKSMVF